MLTISIFILLVILVPVFCIYRIVIYYKAKKKREPDTHSQIFINIQNKD